MPVPHADRTSGLFLAATGIAALSALLHGVASLVPPGAPAPLTLLAALAWAMLAAGLARRLRAVAWIAFFAALAGLIAALFLALGAWDCLRTTYGAIGAAHALLAMILFRLLWRDGQRARQPDPNRA